MEPIVNYTIHGTYPVQLVPTLKSAYNFWKMNRNFLIKTNTIYMNLGRRAGTLFTSFSGITDLRLAAVSKTYKSQKLN